MNVYVKGGTNAGRKKPPRPRASSWRCECSVVLDADADAPTMVAKTNPGYLVRCPDCGTSRP